MKRSQFTPVIAVVAIAILAGASAAAGQTAPAGQAPTTTPSPGTSGQEGVPQAEPAKVKDLATKTGVSEEKLAAMRASGLGWGEIQAAILIAERASVTGASPVSFSAALDKVLASRTAGLGWGEIAKANGFKLGEVVGKGSGKRDSETPTGAGTVVEPPETSGKTEKPGKTEKAEKPEKAGKPEKPEKPEKIEKPEKTEKPEKPEKADKGSK